MATLSAITASNVASSPTGSWTAANGDLETIAGASDIDYSYTDTNATSDNDQGFLLDAFPSDLGNVDTLSVRLRYAWQVGTQTNTWAGLSARVVRDSDGAVLAAADSGGAFKTVASSITTTTFTNSASTAFDYVNTSATKADWEGARLEIRISITKNKGGDTIPKRVSAAEVSGTYSLATAPGQPTGLGATPGDGQVSLSWTAPASDGGSPITDYLVEYNPNGAGWSTFADGTSTNTTATVTGLTNGVSHDFRVSAINAIGTGTASATASATPAVSAFPVVSTKGTFYTSASDTPATSHDIPVPAGVASGDLLLVMAAIDNNTGTVSMTGFTQLALVQHTGSTQMWAAYKFAAGSESGTIALATSVSEVLAAQMWRITSAHASAAPEIQSATGTGSTPDSPSITPSWGSADNLVISACGMNGGIGTVSTWPYADNQANGDTGGSGAAGGGWCSDELTGTSHDPGAWSVSGANDWIALTIAVQPAGGVSLGTATAAVSVSASGTAKATRKLTATAAVSVTPTGAVTPTTKLTGTSDVTVTPAATGPDLTRTFTGTTQVDVAASGTVQRVADLTGTAAVAVAASATGPDISRGIAGTAAVTIAASATGPDRTAAITGTSAVTVTPAATGPDVTHTFTGTAAVTISATGSVTVEGGTVDLGTATAAVAVAASGAVDRIVTPTGTTSVAVSASGAVDRVAALTGTSAVTVTPAATGPDVTHTFTGTTTVTVTPAATGPDRTAPLTGTAAVDVAATGTATGTRYMSGTAAVTIATTGNMDGTTLLIGSTAATVTASGAVTVTHQIGGTAAVTVATTGTATRIALASGTSSLAVASTGQLARIATLQSTTALTLGAAGAVTATRYMVGSVPVTIAPVGAITVGAAGLSGTAEITVGTLGFIWSLAGAGDDIWTGRRPPTTTEGRRPPTTAEGRRPATLVAAHTHH